MDMYSIISYIIFKKKKQSNYNIPIHLHHLRHSTTTIQNTTNTEHSSKNASNAMCIDVYFNNSTETTMAPSLLSFVVEVYFRVRSIRDVYPFGESSPRLIFPGRLFAPKGLKLAAA